VTTDLAHLVKNNIYVYGIRGEGRSATRRAMALMAEKRFDATKFIPYLSARRSATRSIRARSGRGCHQGGRHQQAGWHTRERSGGVELQSREARNLLLCIQCADRFPIRTRRMACKCFGPAEKQRGRLVDISGPLEAFCRGVEFTGSPMRETLGIGRGSSRLLRRLLPRLREQFVNLYGVARPLTRIASSSRHANVDPVSATVISEAAIVVP